jgi:predicted Fe-Mo cluster-binding NifX family protein
MKVCIPTLSDSGLEAIIAEDFGDAVYLTVVDSVTGQVIANSPSSIHPPGGSGARDAAEALRALGAEAVLCRSLGRGASSWLAGAGLPVFLTNAFIAREALESVGERLSALEPGLGRNRMGRGGGRMGRGRGGMGGGRGPHGRARNGAPR